MKIRRCYLLLLGFWLSLVSGMLAAAGQFRFICDADLSMPIEQINRFLPPQLDGIDIAIASRESPGAVRYNEPEYRHLTGRVFLSQHAADCALRAAVEPCAEVQPAAQKLP